MVELSERSQRPGDLSRSFFFHVLRVWWEIKSWHGIVDTLFNPLRFSWFMCSTEREVEGEKKLSLPRIPFC